MTRTASDMVWEFFGGAIGAGVAIYILVKLSDWRATKLDRAARKEETVVTDHSTRADGSDDQ